MWVSLPLVYRLRLKMINSLFAACLAVALLSSVPAFAESKHGDHGHHMHDKALHLTAGPNAPSVKATIKADLVGGYNLHIMVTNFRFAPENASGIHVDGEGHGHIYVNGKKIARLYGEWFHIASLPKTGADVKVTLNANDHRDIFVDGKMVAATVRVGQAMAPVKHNVHKH